jgi:hypothetical protein
MPAGLPGRVKFCTIYKCSRDVNLTVEMDKKREIHQLGCQDEGELKKL